MKSPSAGLRSAEAHEHVFFAGSLALPAALAAVMSSIFCEAQLFNGSGASRRLEPNSTASVAMRNGTLQGAYLLLAACALRLDAWPLTGFDNAAVNLKFFAGTQIQSNFLCSLGYAEPDDVRPRGAAAAL